MLWSIGTNTERIAGLGKSQTPWEEAKVGEVYQSLVAYCHLLDTHQKPRVLTMLKNYCLYTMGHSMGFDFGSASYLANRAFTERPMTQSGATFNLAKSCVDTVANKISKNKVKVTIVTDRGDFSIQRKAEKLDRAVYSLMFDGDFRQVSKDVFRDAEVAGTGIVKTYPTSKTVKYERVLPWEVLVDETDAVYGNPSKLHQYRVVSRASLAKGPKWTKAHRDIIEKASEITIGSSTTAVDSVLVYEGWDLTTGRHCICLDSGDLVDETIPNLEFPFSFIRWTSPAMGFWGISLVDEIKSIHVEVNKHLYFVGKAMQLGHAPKWIIPQAAGLPKNYLNNEIGQILPITGDSSSIQYYTPTPISPQVIEYIQFLTDKAYANAGISQLSAQSIKPAGINSGVAMQTYNDIESERFILSGQEFENLYVSVFKKTIVAAKTVAEINPSFEVMSSNPSHGLETIRWNEIDMEADKFVVKPFPTSALPQTPEGRLQRLNDWMNLGLIGQEDVMELADFPDLQEYRENNKSASISAKELVTRIIETAEVIYPSKFDNLALCAKIATQQYLNLRTRGAPEAVLAVLDEFIDICISSMPAPAVEPPPAMLPPPPGAVPVAPVV